MVALAKTERPVAITQYISAGNNFTGAKPSLLGTDLEPAFASDIFNFPAADVAGLFDPLADYYAFEPREALELIGVEIKLGNQSSWNLTRQDINGNSYVLYTGSTETSFATGIVSTQFVILWGDVLKLITVGSTQAMNATLKFKPHKDVASR